MNQQDIIQKLSSGADVQQPADENIPPEIPQTQIPEIQSQGLPQEFAQPVQQTDEIDAIKNTAAKDIQILQNLMRSGIINPVQGQHLINYVLNKAYQTIVTKNKAAAPLQNQGIPAQTPQMPVSGIADFEKENPDFFKQNGRGQVLEYLKNSNAVVDKDELLRISQMVEMLENSAVDGYLQKQAHSKSLNDENEAAKKKLRANAQNSNSGEANTRIFTREQIGKMSGAEFAKNERIIMEQLRKGLIR